MSEFDDYFNKSQETEVPFKAKDWSSYHKKQIGKLKKIPLEIKAKRKSYKKILTENNFEITFQSVNNTLLTGNLIATKRKPPIVIIFSDYHEEPAVYQSFTNAGIAQFIIKLRGHDKALLTKKIQKRIDTLKKDAIDSDNPKSISLQKQKEFLVKEDVSYGYFAENLLDKENYYLQQLYLDAYRTIEVIRTRKEINTSKIGIWGRGIGAAMALYVTYFMKKTTSLFLEDASFINLELTQNKSNAKYAKEINKFIKSHKKIKNTVKENLSYFDAFHFAQNIEIPLSMSISMGDDVNSPYGGFSAFHQIPAKKEMHVITENDEKLAKKNKKLIVQTAVDFFQENLF